MEHLARGCWDYPDLPAPSSGGCQSVRRGTSAIFRNDRRLQAYDGQASEEKHNSGTCHGPVMRRSLQHRRAAPEALSGERIIARWNQAPITSCPAWRSTATSATWTAKGSGATAGQVSTGVSNSPATSEPAGFRRSHQAQRLTHGPIWDRLTAGTAAPARDKLRETGRWHHTGTLPDPLRGVDTCLALPGSQERGRPTEPDPLP